MSDTEAPPSHVTIQIDGVDQEIFFSFGLVGELAALVGSIDRVIAIDLDPDVAMDVVNACLVPRDSRGRRLDLDFSAPPISTEVADEILSAAGEHVIGFFIKGLTRGFRRIQANQQSLTAAGSLLATSNPSASPKP